MNNEMQKVSDRLWEPSPAFKEHSNLSAYMKWLKTYFEFDFRDYQPLWQWSVDQPEAFWESIWNYFRIKSYTPYKRVMSEDPMPFTRWFEGASLNYAEHVFRNETDRQPAIIYQSESGQKGTISWKELKQKVAAFRKFLKDHGVQKGDRVVAYISNIPEANMAFLAVNSLGAIWSATSPDFGTESVIDRFLQIRPKVLIAVDGYSYGGKKYNRLAEVKAISEALPGLEKVVVVSQLGKEEVSRYLPNAISWEETVKNQQAGLVFEPVPFDHPIWVLYSSGTTGLPKPITHSNGGILLENLKYLTFHNDMKPGDHCFWYTTTGWMMWNYIQASLLCGGVLVLFDGSPGWPDMNVLWKFAGEVPIHHFGTSAAFILANMKAGTTPGRNFDLTQLRSVSSTGSPLPPEGFAWVYKEVKKDLWLASMSGGTDVCSAFVGGNPLWPVYSGEIQCRALGCKLEAYDENGQSVFNRVGEMVISRPMPSMPVYFWNDPDYKRYKESYFEMFPGVWRHGDWTRITPRNGIVIYGRSDATLNRDGVRIGTSEIYRAVEQLPQIKDSLVIGMEKEGGDFYMPLFVILQEGISLDEMLIRKIKQTIRSHYSPRHVPDEIIEVQEIPYTLSGKKMETPVKWIFSGKPPEKAINPDAVRNPDSLKFFTAFAEKKNCFQLNSGFNHLSKH